MITSLATLEDAKEILALQKLAYQSEAELYGDFTIAPLVQTLAEMEYDLRTQVTVKTTHDGAIVASARAHQTDETVHIGRVVVHPSLQGQGLGKQIMAAIEAQFPSAHRFELFTGHLSTRNLNFYRALGYREIRTAAITSKLSFVYLEKRPGLRF